MPPNQILIHNAGDWHDIPFASSKLKIKITFFKNNNQQPALEQAKSLPPKLAGFEM